MPEERLTFSELYAKASDADKQQIRIEVREAFVELGLLLTRVHDVAGQLKAAFSDAELLNELTSEVLERPRDLVNRYISGGQEPKEGLSEKKEPIVIGMQVIIDERKGGKYGGRTGIVRQLIADQAIVKMDDSPIDLEFNSSLLRHHEPEDDED